MTSHAFTYARSDLLLAFASRGRPKADYRDYRPARERSSYSPGRDYPPMKRMRGDYDDARSRYGAHDPYAVPYGWGGGGHDHYGMHPMGGGGYGQMAREHHHREANVASDTQTQPCLMTLKQFLATQDDSISDSDAIEKYAEYKLEFKRQQLNEFFVAHKDEEW